MEDIDGPIRSRFRGLSWDKKHQGWRVRIYYSGKQRHVGRFEDDVAAARAYDKAAVYLYGANAITNFGIQACQEDPTEVSAFIVLAKEQADQEQQARNQQRNQQYNHLSDMYKSPQLPGATSQLVLLPDGTIVPALQQQMQMQMQQQQQQPAMNIVHQQLDAWAQQQQQQQAAGFMAAAVGNSGLHFTSGNSGSSGNFATQHLSQQQQPLQQQQRWAAAQPGPQLTPTGVLNPQLSLPQMASPISSSRYMMMPAASPMETSSSNASSASSSAPAMSNNSNATSSNLSNSGSFTHMMHNVLLPMATQVPAGLTSSNSIGPHQLDAAALPLPGMANLQQHSQPQQLLLQHLNGVVMPPPPQQQQQQQLPQQQQQQQLPQQQQQQAQQQQQQHSLLFLRSSQPLQLSVQPQLTTITSHLTAHSQAQQALLQQQQLLQGFGLQDLTGTQGFSSAPMALVEQAAAPAATGGNLPGNGMQQQLATANVQGQGQSLQQQQQQQQQQFDHEVHQLNVSMMLAAAAACSNAEVDPFVEDMLHGLGYGPAVAPPAAAAAVGSGGQRIPSPLPQQQQQQQLMLMMGSRSPAAASWGAVGTVSSSQAMAECGSSSCSPMIVTACAAPLTMDISAAAMAAAAAAGGGGSGGGAAGAAGCRVAALHAGQGPAATTTSGAGAAVPALMGSPTYSTSSSSGSSSSNSFGLRKPAVC